MLHKNSFPIGFILGLFIPIVGFAILLELYEQLDAMGLSPGKGFAASIRTRTTALIALCFNLIPFQIYYARKLINSMRGISLPTIIYGIAWFIWFGKDLF